MALILAATAFELSASAEDLSRAGKAGQQHTVSFFEREYRNALFALGPDLVYFKMSTLTPFHVQS